MKKILLVLVAAMFVFSCNMGNNSGDASKDGAKDEAKQEKSSKGTDKIYAIESGYVKYKMVQNNIEMFTTLYFKDYGKELAASTEMDMAGQKMENHMLSKDGYMYMYNKGTKQGMKMKSEQGEENSFQGFSMNEEIVEKVGGKKVGTEKFLGKECNIYEIPDENDAKKLTKAWVWKGVPVKISRSEESVMEAVEIEETSDFPKGTFEIPDDVKFAEAPVMDKPKDKSGSSDFDEEGAKG